MRCIFGAVIAAFLLTAASAEDVWSTFRDPAGAYSVEMPGTPTVSTQSTKAGDGKDIPIVIYTVDRGSAADIVMVADFTGYEVDPGKAIDNGVATISASGKTIQTNTIDQLDGQVGRNIGFVDPDGDHYTDRIFFVNSKLYQVMTVIAANNDPAQKESAGRFSASFHFTLK
jgi:hypothetical protein